MESRVPLLGTTASAGPFIGLFGTVWGLMNSFRNIGAKGAANLATVAPGIAEALVATAIGLMAAIPAVMAYNFFSRGASACSAPRWRRSRATSSTSCGGSSSSHVDGGGSSSSGGGMGSLTEINVTPLVDVMLVLLIIFMVTAPMLQTGVDVNLPQAKAQTRPDDEGKLILTVTKDKRVFLGKLQIQWDDVEKTLKNNAKLNADHELYLHADKDLLYGDVVKIMAAVKQAGVDKLGMVTDPLE